MSVQDMGIIAKVFSKVGTLVKLEKINTPKKLFCLGSSPIRAAKTGLFPPELCHYNGIYSVREVRRKAKPHSFSLFS